jgi:hypothetical protein
MRLFALALWLSLAAVAGASAQTATPDSEYGRYSFNPVADGVLRLDTHTGQVSQCSRSDAGWACKAVPDERSALETEIARLQGENDAEVDKMISFLEKVWRRLIEMAVTVQKDVEKKN